MSTVSKHNCPQDEQNTSNSKDNQETTSQNLGTISHCFGSGSSTKEWQQQLPQDHRSHSLKGIVLSILKAIQQDSHSLSSECLTTVKNYAQEIEEDAFNSGTSYDDYFQRIDERIYRIQKTYDEKQQISRLTVSSTNTLSAKQDLRNDTTPKLDDNSDSSSAITLPLDEESSDEHDPSKGTEPQLNDIHESHARKTLSEHVDKDNDTPININRLATFSDNQNPHANTNGNPVNAAGVDTEKFSLSPHAIIEAPITDGKIPAIPKTPVTVRSVTTTTTTIEMKKRRNTHIESDKRNRPASFEATSKSLSKHPAVFASDDIRDKMTPILRHLHDHKEGVWFRDPVTEAIAPGYFDIIKHPMDFSTIFKKFDENQYTTPFQFWEDMWLVFNNTWTFNKKTQRVYKAGVKLSDIFMKSVDPIMKDYGYCCGRQYVFLPPAMFCYGVGGICCTIPRDGDYFVYNNPDSSRNNLSGDKYTFCKKCFDSVKSEYISVGDDPAQTLVELPKCEFQQAKNDHQELEIMVDCIVCSRRFHNICVLHHEHIWPEGYICRTCVSQYNIERNDNPYLSHKLTETTLSSALEERVNTFLQYECDGRAGHVTIRVLAASDRVCEVKPRFKKHFGSQIPDGYPYRTKAIFAFQEIEGVDVVLFGMHVQEYDSQCPEPNARRVYISYLDSIHYFQPKARRTELYHEILIGYLEYAKQLGFVYAHIWACPPKKNDDYIFHCHPVEQRVPEAKRLQEWYKTMLDMAILQRVIINYKDIMTDCIDNETNKVTNIPYFEGDYWPDALEELIQKFETEITSDNQHADGSFEMKEPTEGSKKRKTCGNRTYKKKKRSDLISKTHAMMKTEKKLFFVVRLCNPVPDSAAITGTDPLIQCDLMESRNAFLSFACDNHCEFSSLRRAKYSTMVLLYKLLSPTADKSSYTCNACQQLCDVPYHCTVCEDYDLCMKCYTTIKHEHRIERSDETNETTHEEPREGSDEPSETTVNSDTPVNIEHQGQTTMQGMLEAIRHAVQCQNANCLLRTCASCKRLLQHVKECTEVLRIQCPLCNKLLSSIWFHAKTCTDQNCPLPYCTGFKKKIQRQRAVIMQGNPGRAVGMHQAKTEQDNCETSLRDKESLSHGTE